MYVWFVIYSYCSFQTFHSSEYASAVTMALRHSTACKTPSSPSSRRSSVARHWHDRCNLRGVHRPRRPDRSVTSYRACTVARVNSGVEPVRCRKENGQTDRYASRPWPYLCLSPRSRSTLDVTRHVVDANDARVIRPVGDDADCGIRQRDANEPVAFTLQPCT